MIRPGSEPWSPGSLANTVNGASSVFIYIYIYISLSSRAVKRSRFILSHHLSLSVIPPSMSSRLHPVSVQICFLVGYHWQVYLKESIDECPYFSSSALHILFIYLDDLRDERQVAIQLLFSMVLLSGLIQYSA